LNASDSQGSDSDDDVIKENYGPYIEVLKDYVHLTSPTFGSKLKIWRPKVKFGSSKAALKDLIHIE
jgi:hypothetical protein